MLSFWCTLQGGTRLTLKIDTRRPKLKWREYVNFRTIVTDLQGATATAVKFWRMFVDGRFAGFNKMRTSITYGSRMCLP